MKIEEKINIIKNFTDDDFLCLTKKQKIIVDQMQSGFSIYDIAKYQKCSRQNIHQSINIVLKKLENRNVKGVTRKKGKKRIYDFSQYKDLFKLTKREREIVLFLIKNPILTNEEIGKEFGIKGVTVSTILFNARKKLIGEWENERINHNEYAKNYRKRHSRKKEKVKKYQNQKEYQREYGKKYREKYKNRIQEYSEKYKKENEERLKEYSRKYYAKNREKILFYQKEKRQQAKMERMKENTESE